MDARAGAPGERHGCRARPSSQARGRSPQVGWSPEPGHRGASPVAGRRAGWPWRAGRAGSESKPKPATFRSRPRRPRSCAGTPRGCRVGEVHLDQRSRELRAGVADRVGVVGESRGVEHDRDRGIRGLVQPVRRVRPRRRSGGPRRRARLGAVLAARRREIGVRRGYRRRPAPAEPRRARLGPFNTSTRTRHSLGGRLPLRTAGSASPAPDDRGGCVRRRPVGRARRRSRPRSRGRGAPQGVRFGPVRRLASSRERPAARHRRRSGDRGRAVRAPQPRRGRGESLGIGRTEAPESASWPSRSIPMVALPRRRPLGRSRKPPAIKELMRAAGSSASPTRRRSSRRSDPVTARLDGDPGRGGRRQQPPPRRASPPGPPASPSGRATCAPRTRGRGDPAGMRRNRHGHSGRPELRAFAQLSVIGRGRRRPRGPAGSGPSSMPGLASPSRTTNRNRSPRAFLSTRMPASNVAQRPAAVRRGEAERCSTSRCRSRRGLVEPAGRRASSAT